MKKGIRIIGIVVMNLFLYFILLYPNPVLFLEQIHRQKAGIDELVETQNPRFIKFAEKAYSSEKEPGGYVLQEIEQKRDAEIYWNIEYWAMPHETIEKKAGDCEDLAILMASVYEYGKHKKDIRGKTEIIKQEKHYYVDVNTTTEKKEYKKLPVQMQARLETIQGKIQAYIRELPAWRWIFLLIAIFLGNILYYQKICRSADSIQ